MKKFEYPVELAKLNDANKLSFYLFLAKELTISNRIILADDDLSRDEKLNRLKPINEITHRVVSRIEELVSGNPLLSDEDMWGMIKHGVAQCPSIGGEVGSAISRCYKKVGL